MVVSNPRAGGRPFRHERRMESKLEVIRFQTREREDGHLDMLIKH